MGVATMTRNERSPGRNGSDGFSTLEVLAAMFVITIALTGLLSLFGYAISTMSLMQDLLIAKQKSREALESIYTARNTSQITFDMIQNVSASPGIFVDGYQPLERPQSDGLIGTSDDSGVETLRLPGPDGALNTGDDELRVLDTFERQIQIDPILFADSSVNPDIRRVLVSIRYNTPMGGQSTYTVESYISRYR
jgi:type II secretory pathway pseudopilin PulG